MMKEQSNPHLKRALLEAVDNQLAAPETSFVKEKYVELTSKYGANRAKEMIAAALIGELYDMQMQNRTYDDARYRKLVGELQ